MNQMKITFTGEMSRRWKENTKSGKEMIYISVKVPRGDWSDTFKIKVKDMDTVKPYAVGAKVTCEAFVGGREWKNPDTGKISYFTDVNLIKIEAVKESATAVASTAVDDDSEELPF